ncbi:nicotinate-nucleotide pyrophosphorylase [Cucumis melo var. makuwa]|uniref:Nicotinate-nucleotide pyrophosphorylase n=1 Tax=Cucumis melo var. makuwa TaxID=1194695 RepID=A0A5D3E068_CUCMM|nr:nicotinate-nucleotide pyrophosphorylase [Cucumis melo var. makuwa]
MSASVSNDSGISVASVAIQPPSHPTYDLRGIIKLALAEDSADFVIGGLTIPLGSKVTLSSRWNEGNCWFIEYTDSHVASLSGNPFHFTSHSFAPNSGLQRMPNTGSGHSCNLNSAVSFGCCTCIV